jgi:hypothetical protein
LVEFAMHGAIFVKEGPQPSVGLVDKLIDHHQMARLDVFLKGTDRPAGQQGPHAQLFHREDIGRIGNNAWAELVALAVAVEKDDLPLAEPAGDQRAAGLAEGRFHGHRLGVRNVRQEGIAQSRPANDTDHRFLHGVILVQFLNPRDYSRQVRGCRGWERQMVNGKSQIGFP